MISRLEARALGVCCANSVLPNGYKFNGGRGRSRTHQARIRTSTALKAARPTGDDALPPSMLSVLGIKGTETGVRT